MTLTVRPTPLSEEWRDVIGPTSTYVSTPPEERLGFVMGVQRRDYSQLVIEGTRRTGHDGVLRYFYTARLDLGGGAAGADRATSFETGGRVALDLGGERIVAVSSRDVDGDGSRDIIALMEDGALQVFLVTDVDEAVTSSPPPEASSSEALGAGAPTNSSALSSEGDYEAPYDEEPDPDRLPSGPGPGLTDEGLQPRISSGAQAPNEGQVTTEGI